MNFKTKKEIAMRHMKEWNRGNRVSNEVWEYVMWHYPELFLHIQSDDATIKNESLRSLKIAFVEAKRECDEVSDQEEVKKEARRRRNRIRRRVSNMTDEQVEAQQRQRDRVDNMGEERVEAKRRRHQVDNMNEEQVETRCRRVNNIIEERVEAR